MKEDQSRQRHNGAGAKAPRQVGETAGRPVCLEHSEGEGEGDPELSRDGGWTDAHGFRALSLCSNWCSVVVLLLTGRRQGNHLLLVGCEAETLSVQ